MDALSITLFLILIHSPLTIKVNANHLQLRPPFPAILIFGDSTVDTGTNNHIPTVFRSNHLPYGRDFPNSIPTGRFSNGRLSVDMIATSLKIKSFVPPFLDPHLSPLDLITGVSFASGGCGFDNTTGILVSIPIDVQLHQFDEYVLKLNRIVGAGEAERILTEALVIISAGTNDFVMNYYNNVVRSFDQTVTKYQSFLLSKMQNVIKSLYDKGCRKMIIVGLPPIGCLPIQMTVDFDNTECVKEQNDDALVFNKKLSREVFKMRMQFPGIKICQTDIYSVLEDMVKNPSKYGFEVTNVGCCGSGLVEAGPLCNVFSTACEDSRKYVFWDAIHPTEAAYAYIAHSIVRQCLA